MFDVQVYNMQLEAIEILKSVLIAFRDDATPVCFGIPLNPQNIETFQDRKKLEDKTRQLCDLFAVHGMKCKVHHNGHRFDGAPECIIVYRPGGPYPG